ncbi:BNR repeat domain protein [Candidatus Magnetomorum sp. HK-1]|nr:BNR repeat domain protein [Candidatus Magnetomorum sp. HK-1]
MKGFKRFCGLFFCFILIITGYAWANDAPNVFVPSLANHIVAGGHHSMAVDENGKLWAWGSNGSGRLGNANAGFKVAIPIPVNKPDGEGQLTDIISVAAGFSHSMALQKDGKVMAWGSNNTSQLGNISVGSESYLPVYVNGPASETYLTDIIAIAAGKQHSVALRSDGTVWTWGDNTLGQLGNNNLLNQQRPIQVTGPSGTGYLTNVVAVSAGSFHTLALKKNGSVWAWGSNSDGQIGLDKGVEFQKIPICITQLSQITRISAGFSHNIARKSNGTVWTWGNNADGQLGYFTGNDYSISPQQVKAVDGIGDLMNVVDVIAAFSHSMALKDDGTLVAWGSNANGRLGNGTETSNTLPTFVKDSDGIDILKNVIGIGAGDEHSLALLKDGQVLSWGLNNDGQLGDMSGTPRLFPVFVRGENQEDTLQLGQQYMVLHVNEDQPSVSVLLILRDINGGKLTLSATSSDEAIIDPQKFAFNRKEQPFSITVPSEESLSVTFTFSSEQNIHGSAMINIITEDPFGGRDNVRLQVIISPVNDYPAISSIDSIQINEDSTSGLIPFMVQDVDGDTLNVSARSYNTEIIPTSGLKLFGDTNNRNIQITPKPNANGSTLVSLTVSDPSGLSRQTNFYVNVKSINDLPEMTIWPGIVQVTSGYYHNIAIKNDWTVWAWGSNSSGQLGDQSDDPRNLPVQVKGPDGMGWLTNIVAVAAGSRHSLALSGDGHVLAWGNNIYGQLGNSTFDESFTPVYVLDDQGQPIENVINIVSGANHALLLTEDNQLWAWGKNDQGQLGDNTRTNQNHPVRVTGVYQEYAIIQIAAGDSHSMLLFENGQVWTWGDNTSGQLGIGSIVSSIIPVRVLQANSSDPLENIVSISAGAFHSMALSNEGHIWTFGLNANGQLGNGGPIYTTSPIKVQHPDKRTVLSNIGQIAAGTDHSMAFQNNGVIWSWGKNDGGQLGYGSKLGNYYPAQVNTESDISLSRILAIDAGKAHTIVQTANGEVWAWGNNYSFQLGSGTTIESLIPKKTLSSDGSEPFMTGIIPLEFYTSDGKPSRPIKVTLYDLETPANNLVLTAMSQGIQILPQSNISVQGSGVNRQIILTPLENKTGKVSVDVSVSDNSDIITKQLTLGVNKFSIKPVISQIPDQFIIEDQPLKDLKFTIEDPDTPISELTIQVSSGNIALVPNNPNSITLTGESSEKTLHITPLPDKFGETLIIIRVSDGINDIQTNFNLSVQPINDPPVISDIEDHEIGAGIFSTSIGFTIFDLESEAQHLTAWAISSNNEIVSNDAIHLKITGTSTHRTIGITPSKDKAGDVLITIFASDGVNTSSTNFILRVQGNKHSPQISNIDNQTIQEDSNITVLFTLIDADSGSEQLTLSVYSSNSYVVPNTSENLQIKGSGINRTLTVVPKNDGYGSTNITITAEDPDHLFAQVSFLLTVENINDPPTISEIDDQLIKENTSTNALMFTIHDSETAASNLSFTVTSNNTLLVPEDSAHLYVTEYEEYRTLIVTPVKNTVGTSTIRIQISDGEFTAWESFFLTVEPENFPPEISNISDQSTEIDNSIQINFSISDREMGAHLLALTVKSSDPSLVPNDSTHLELSGVQEQRSLNITPISGKYGQLTITLFVEDDRSVTQESFLLNVNNPPEISRIDNHVTDEDQKTAFIPFFIYDIETNAGQLKVVAKSSNTDLIPNKTINIILGGNDTDRNISILPAANQSGTATIDVSVFDGYSTAHTYFEITVNPVNDPPFISAIDQVTTHEDIAPPPIAVVIGDVETQADFLTVSVLSDNPILIPLTNINITTQSASRYLSLTPTAHAFGDATITVIVADSQGLTASQKFMVQVMSVNDIPLPVDQIHTTRVNVPIINHLFAKDMDGDTLTYAIKAMPAKGSLTLINSDTGEFLYHPNPENWGYDSFTFTAYDGFSTSAEGTVTIDIQDLFPPKITLMGLNPDYIMLGQLFVEKGWNAYDNADGDISDQVERFGIVNTEILGTYHVLYRVKDMNGNIGQIIREVIVIENAGNFQGTIEEIPFNLIPEPEKDIKVQLLDSISQKILRETGITMDGSIGRFTFETIPFQSYIVRAIVSDSIINEPPAYVSQTIEQHFLFQSNNQQIRLNVPELTLLENSYALEVELGGTYRLFDAYQYLIIDYKTGRTVREGENDKKQFTEYLEAGNYRLLILAKAYAPLEYADQWGNKFISLDQNVSLTDTDRIELTDDPEFNPNDARVDISHTLADSNQGDAENGFYLWFVRRDFNSDDQFAVTILTESGEVYLNENLWGGNGMVDNQPYVYTWTTSSNLYYSIEEDKPHMDDKTYTIMFYFYQGAERIQSYSVSYVLRSQNSTVIANEKLIFQNFIGETVRYETQSQRTFYPLAGAMLNISFKDNMGNVIHKGISIPPIPLEFLIIEDKQMEIQSSDQLIATIRYYTFNGDVISNGVSIDFTTTDDKKVLYNPKPNRDPNAPVITVPLYLNRESTFFNRLQQTRLSQAKDSMHIMVYDDSEVEQNKAFRNEDLSYIVQDDGLVLINIHHLSMITLEANEAWNTFKNSDLNDGRCFIKTIQSSGLMVWPLVMLFLGIIVCRKHIIFFNSCKRS